jgi:transcriptional regulator with XRE-family HTH domain
LLSYARRSAGLSQRELAERSGIPQPAIARIESGRSTPRFDTLATLLRACGLTIGLEPAAGEGVDRTAIRMLRRLTPAQRAEIAVREAHNLERVVAGRRR